MADVLAPARSKPVIAKDFVGYGANDLYRLSRPARASNPGPASPCLKHVIIEPFLAVLGGYSAPCATFLFPIRKAIPSTGIENVACGSVNRRLP
jgi:hypothetical protein